MIVLGINKLRQPRTVYCISVCLLTIRHRTGNSETAFLKEETNLNTYMAKAEDVQRKWFIVDADGAVLGRLASQVANVLRGKHKPIYTPHVDTGDYVIIINADKVVLTGKKLDQKIYYHHSGYPGGLSETLYRTLMAEKPDFVVKKAIIGMLPKGSLGHQMAKKLRVYVGAEHAYESRKPEKLEIK
jgi:large subunit ribosomal protein L13